MRCFLFYLMIAFWSAILVTISWVMFERILDHLPMP